MRVSCNPRHRSGRKYHLEDIGANATRRKDGIAPNIRVQTAQIDLQLKVVGINIVPMIGAVMGMGGLY